MSSKKVKFKKGIFQKLFWLISIIFIILIIVIFVIKFISAGSRFNSDKKLYEYIISNGKVSKVDDFYYYKGEDSLNYLKYGNLLFRIVKIYKDGSMDIITNNSINSLYNKNNDVHKYINDVFYENIDHDYLNTSPYCEDVIDDAKNITCDKINFSSYVKLLPLSDYVNSIDSEKTYLSDMWLGTNGSDFVWVINDGKLVKDKDGSINDVYPVVTINNSIKYLSGDGSYDNPYIVKSNSKIGAYVKILDDTYIVNEISGSNLKLSLVSDKILVRKMFNSNFIDELNLDYYNELEYKDLLVKYKVGISEYKDTYKDSYKDKKEVYIGYPMVSDLKLDTLINDYYLINSGNTIYYYNNGLKIGDKNLSMKIRPVIMIKSLKIGDGSGTMDDPYIVEVK